jgi:hypothetical protein
LIIRQELLDQTGRKYQSDFLAEVVYDWYALYEQVFGYPAKMLFEDAWDIGDDIMSRLDYTLVPSEKSPAYELIHEALSAAAKGIPPDDLESGLQTFFDAMPCVEAGLVLFRASVMPAQPRVEKLPKSDG